MGKSVPKDIRGKTFFIHGQGAAKKRPAAPKNEDRTPKGSALWTPAPPRRAAGFHPLDSRWGSRPRPRDASHLCLACGRDEGFWFYAVSYCCADMPAIRTAGISGYFCEILRAGFFFLDYYKPLTAKTAGKSMAERRHQFSGGRYRSFPLTALHIQAQLHQHTLFIMKMRNRYIHQLHIGN